MSGGQRRGWIVGRRGCWRQLAGLAGVLPPEHGMPRRDPMWVKRGSKRWLDCPPAIYSLAAALKRIGICTVPPSTGLPSSVLGFMR